MSTLTTTNVRVSNIQNSTGTTAFTIDASGRVRNNTFPYFFATRTTSADISIANTNLIPFPDIKHNRGNVYDASTFTAPITGVYMFHVKTLTPSNTDQLDLRWYRNGAQDTTLGAGYAGNWSGHKTMISFLLTELQANDTLQPRTISSPGVICCNVHNSFCGYLVG